jgi:HAD superfamily hydrolase (TIGR01509 family)
VSLAGVLWDMDGTIVDSEPSWLGAQAEIVAEHGGVWGVAEAEALLGADMAATVAALQAAGVALPHDDVEARLERAVADALRTVPMRPGAFELIEEVAAAGIPQAIVTTSSSLLASVVAARLPAGALGTIVTAERVARGKPHPDPYLLAAEELGLDPARCVAIEDSPIGLAAAIAAGTAAIGVPSVAPLPAGPGWLEWPSLAGRTLADLEGWLAERAPSREG